MHTPTMLSNKTNTPSTPKEIKTSSDPLRDRNMVGVPLDKASPTANKSSSPYTYGKKSNDTSSPDPVPKIDRVRNKKGNELEKAYSPIKKSFSPYANGRRSDGTFSSNAILNLDRSRDRYTSSVELDKSSSTVKKSSSPYAINGRKSAGTFSSNAVLNFDRGDPVVFGPYWKKMGDKCTVVIKGHDYMSYLNDVSNVCWFLLPELGEAIKKLHGLVKNAAIEGKHIVVGTGSTQLFQAALFALSSDAVEPLPVVAAAPFYSEYKDESEYLRSGLYRWGGDANKFDEKGPYIEVVNYPNNPDGKMRKPVVNNGSNGKLVYDLAYYWPQYTHITHMADHDIMLFTFSKCTGHAGSRIGWALVKDKDVATRMTRFVHMSSIGVSRESQFRASKIMGVILDGYKRLGSAKSDPFFEFGRKVLAERWEKLRKVVKQSEAFSVTKFPQAYCRFTKETCESFPAFAWLKSNEGIEDCESLLAEHKIIGRGGKRFGADAKHVRINMLSKEYVFKQFLDRLSNIKRNASKK